MSPEAGADEAELIRIISKIPEFEYLTTLDLDAARHQITHEIAQILREYYWENTRGHGTGWSKRFADAGITEDDGKTAIACARRLGLDIS
jgi:hypothetical protein